MTQNRICQVSAATGTELFFTSDRSSRINMLGWKCNIESTRSDRADSSSWGSLGPSMFAAGCWISSKSLWWRVQSASRPYVGAAASESVTQRNWIKLIKKAGHCSGALVTDCAKEKAAQQFTPSTPHSDDTTEGEGWGGPYPHMWWKSMVILAGRVQHSCLLSIFNLHRII